MDGLLTFTLASQLVGIDADAATVARATAAISEICAAVPTVVVHIVGDPHTLLERSYLTRGEWWRTKLTEQIAALPRQIARGSTGSAGTVEFYEAVQPAVRAMLDPRWPLFVLDRAAGDDRAAGYAALAEFIGYPDMPAPLLESAALGSLAGTYRALDPAAESATMCCVMAEHGLVLTDGTSQIGSLEALSAHQLRLEGTPYVFTFDLDAGTMTLTEPDGTVVEYQRQPS